VPDIDLNFAPGDPLAPAARRYVAPYIVGIPANIELPANFPVLGQLLPYRERTRAAEAGEDPKAVPFLKQFTVFNADQCENLPADVAPPPAPVAEHQIVPQAEALIRTTGADLRIGGSRALYVPNADFIQVPPPSAFFEPVNWHRTVCHELGHYAVSRIMPHGRALRRANLVGAMQQFGIIEPSGNDEVWWETDWRLQEVVFDCRHRPALASLRATSQRTRQRKPPAPRTRRVWAEKT
jgi:hypothetical protein